MKSSSITSDSRNIEITEPEAAARVFRATDALQYMVEKIGFDKVMNGSVRHMGAKLLIRRPFKINLNAFKKVEEDLYLNRKGSVTDKFRTITILNSVYRLNWTIRLTEEPPTKVGKSAKGAKAGAKTTRGPRKRAIASSPESEEILAVISEPITEIPDLEPTDFVFGTNGVLNLFDE